MLLNNNINENVDDDNNNNNNNDNDKHHHHQQQHFYRKYKELFQHRETAAVTVFTKLLITMTLTPSICTVKGLTYFD